MSKPKESKKILSLGGPIPYSVYVILTEDVNRSRSGRSHFLGEWQELPNTGAVHTGMANEGRSYIILPYDTKLDYIAHESFHCVWRIMEYIGACHNEEIMAYYLGYIVEQIALFVKKEMDEPRPAPINN